ncbi:hypothetical protein LTR10_010063 [Elasticomyces elasticus]|nr:hypothetical protein LTR10_010063 [Elasticomyces elasticus]KAK4970355.1 hypothetical protein LTR42_008522 [Elasticomyces elasticus]
MAPRIVYKEHLTAGDNIRILELKQGRTGSPLVARLHSVSLSTCPVYEALSYTWGDCFDSDHPSWKMYQSRLLEYRMRVHRSVIPITRNLHDALQQLRYPDRSRSLWVDAICIDQEHQEEKAYQIGHMRKIYGEAAQVLVWLGPADTDSSVALWVLRAGYRYHLRIQPLTKLGALRVDNPCPDSAQEVEDEMVVARFGQLFGMQVRGGYGLPKYPIEAIANTFSRSYWARGWCWQEFVVPRKVTIICGEVVLEDGDQCMQVFMATWDSLRQEMGRQPHRLDQRPWPMTELRHSYHNKKYLQDTGFQDSPELVTPEGQELWPIQAQENPNATPFAKTWMFRDARNRLLMKNLLAESNLSWLETSRQDDQVYALVGMSTDAEKLGIVIDYSVPWEQVYAKISIAYLERGDLWCLHHCLGSVRPRSSRLPSWAPDWSKGFRGAMVSMHYTPPRDHLGTSHTRGLQDKPVHLGSWRLSLKGILVDEVRWVSEQRPTRHGGDGGAAHTRSLLALWLQSIGGEVGSRHTPRELWTTLIMNATRLPVPSGRTGPEETQTPKPNEKTLEQEAQDEEARRCKLDKAFYQLLRHNPQRADRASDGIWNHILDNYENYSDTSKLAHAYIMGSARPIDDVLESFEWCLLEAMNFKRFFETKDRRIGVAHAGIGVGDRIAVFASTTAFAIRPVYLTSEKPRHRVMCECYVGGLMEDQDLKANAKAEDIILE